MLAKLASIISFRKGVKIYEKIKRNHLAVVGFTTWGKLQWQRISAPTVPKGHQDERCQRALGFRCVCSNRDNQGKTCLSRLQKHPTFQLWYRHVGRSRCVFFLVSTLWVATNSKMFTKKDVKTMGFCLLPQRPRDRRPFPRQQQANPSGACNQILGWTTNRNE